MAGKLVILSIESVSCWFKYAGGMRGLEIDKPLRPSRAGSCWVRVYLTPASKEKLDSWSKEYGLPVQRGRSFIIYGTVGYPDTPELLAYDEIDQQEDEPKKKQSVRKRRITKK